MRGTVGRRHVLTGPAATLRYRRGYRHGEGGAIAVVRPGTLVELWRVAQAAVRTGVAIIVQAANTGLTGGSTPDGDYPGGVLIVSTLRLARIHLLDGGRQALCLPGTTLSQLERALKPLGREPHSVIGSSCLGASVLGGVCNNSGGALVRRGPAYTELALFARLAADGTLQLVNHLGIALGETPEEMLARLERGRFDAGDVAHDPQRRASDQRYSEHVRDIDAETPARFNADPRCLFEASGSAGRVIVFAARLDTFPRDAETTTFYVGTNDPAEFAALRRRLLGGKAALPIAAEYMHRDAFDVAAAYGKDSFLAVRHLGTDRLPALFALKARIDRLARRCGGRRGEGFADRLMQWAARLAPRHLPARMLAWRDRYEHHLLLKMPGGGGDARACLDALFAASEGGYFECTPAEADAAFLHRFACAGAAIRYRLVHADAIEDLVALDFALPRNEQDWTETLPAALEKDIPVRLRYGHFFCHVFHHDYLVRRGADAEAVKAGLCSMLDARRARYPAEHNVGHLYPAAAELAAFYRDLDPCNRLNPGIGKTSKAPFWGRDVHAR
ncbi:D-lactate dehydrogenase [Sphingomonas parva]|uniref:D-lactate dehydrogenase n=1 Tax=Sphingomonas parva TaxID=2555898 RepID=UPI00384BC9B7